MIEYIDVKDALLKEEKIFVDVRSPIEYSDGTIPDAVNMPLFSNEERAEIGTIYKKIGIDEAKSKGIEYAAGKLSLFYKNMLKLSKVHKDIIVFCAKGGLRSGAIVNFLNNIGVKVYQLKGGYKAFRKFTLEYLDNISDYHDFIVLHGYTGVGKTEILEKMANKNVSVLNIEFLAKNTGSVFGNIGYSATGNTINQKNFEASIVNSLLKSKKRTVLVESESKRVGNVILPNNLFEMITKGKHILLQTSIENRVSRLINDYVINVPNHDELLINSIESLRKRIGNESTSKLIQLINNHEYEEVAKELILTYYDPLYKHSIAKYNYALTINYDKIEKAIHAIEDYYYTIEKETK